MLTLCSGEENRLAGPEVRGLTLTVGALELMPVKTGMVGIVLARGHRLGHENQAK